MSEQLVKINDSFHISDSDNQASSNKMSFKSECKNIYCMTLVIKNNLTNVVL